MSTFKVGDRVAIYQDGCRWLGRVKTVDATGGDESVLVQYDIAGEFWLHPKQLRRLKPKAKAREWWVAKQNAGPIIETFDVWTFDPRDGNWDVSKFGEVIHVREVWRKK